MGTNCFSAEEGTEEKLASRLLRPGARSDVAAVLHFVLVVGLGRLPNPQRWLNGIEQTSTSSTAIKSDFSRNSCPRQFTPFFHRKAERMI